MIDLFDNIDNCCGCAACKDACPKDAIKMAENEYGFLYPQIDDKKCINCGMCKKVCAYQKANDGNKPIEAYAVVAKDNEVLIKSASGGAFFAMAEEFINTGGIVYGCVLEGRKVYHCRASNVETLQKMRGSKYVQSDIQDVHKNVKSDLNKGKRVLFSGTPCQVDSLHSYLNNFHCDTTNLITMDIICHGVPSNRLFKDYIRLLEKKFKGDILSVSFRDKVKGRLMILKFTFDDGRIKYINPLNSSYFNQFLKGNIYRDCCYSCKYANEKRAGDITIGDYWDLDKVEKDIAERINVKNGVSAVIINTAKGKDFFDKSKNLIKYESTFENIAKNNSQLVRPTKLSGDREYYLNIYKTKGISAFNKAYFKKNRIIIWKIKLSGLLTESFRNKLKRILRVGR